VAALTGSRLLTQAYKKFPDMTSASIPTVTTLRSSLSMDVFFVYNKFVFLIACFVNSSPEVTLQIALDIILSSTYSLPSGVSSLQISDKNLLQISDLTMHATCPLPIS
jgi:hypothetical protein